jgi:hypothetical protein
MSHRALGNMPRDVPLHRAVRIDEAGVLSAAQCTSSCDEGYQNELNCGCDGNCGCDVWIIFDFFCGCDSACGCDGCSTPTAGCNDQPETFNGWLGLDQELLVKWHGFKGAPILFDVGIGGSPGADDVIPFRSCPANSSSALFEDPFRMGTHYVTVLAWSDAGESVAASAVVKVDTSPPFVGQVCEVDPGRDNFADIHCFMSSSLEIKISWDAFADFESGIERYEVALMISGETLVSNSSASSLHSTRQVRENSTKWYPAGNSTSLMIHHRRCCQRRIIMRLFAAGTELTCIVMHFLMVFT